MEDQRTTDQKLADLEKRVEALEASPKKHEEHHKKHEEPVHHKHDHDKKYHGK